MIWFESHLECGTLIYMSVQKSERNLLEDKVKVPQVFLKVSPIDASAFCERKMETRMLKTFN